jgi:hypothetical protein
MRPLEAGVIRRYITTPLTGSRRGSRWTSMGSRSAGSSSSSSSWQLAAAVQTPVAVLAKDQQVLTSAGSCRQRHQTSAPAVGAQWWGHRPGIGVWGQLTRLPGSRQDQDQVAVLENFYNKCAPLDLKEGQ